MSLSTECLEVSQVASLLQGNLTPEEYEAAQDHLEHCETCRTRVEATIGPEQWWSDVQSVLLNSHPGSFVQRAASSTDAERIEPSTVKLLDLLGPTDDPNMLGRIGPYEIVGLLGQGGMGAVFKGFDRSLNRFVAIKMLLPHLAASGAARRRFAREGQAVAAVVDDHVMAIHCVDEWRGVPYLVMTYSRGITLQKRLSDNGPLEIREILRIGMQAAKGLAAAHAQGIVHRDIKPANIFLDQTVERVQLMDFGLARAVDDASLTRTGVLAGTPQYMSPEQARAETVDHRSDLFSLGSVMYAMCTGHAPFRAESSYSVLRLITDKEPRSIQEINPDVPEWLCAIVARLMAKQACDRFETAKEVALLLEECLAHVQQPLLAPFPKGLAPQSSHRFGFPSNGKGLLVMLGSIGIILMGMLLWSATEPPDISGKWSSGEWGTVELKEKEPGRYEGKLENGLFIFGSAPFDHKQWTNMSCASCHKGRNDFAGNIELKWSRTENRFNGNWSIPENHSGKLSIRLVENEIRGGWTTSKKSDPNPGTPRLGDLAWKRVSSDSDAKANLGDATTSNPLRLSNSEDINSWVHLPKELGKHAVKLDLSLVSPRGKLSLSSVVEQFNEKIKKAYPRQFSDQIDQTLPNSRGLHSQQPLTTDEIVACASWSQSRGIESAGIRKLLTSITHQYQLLDGWELVGEYVDLPPANTPFSAFRISLLHHDSGERFTIRQRFTAPLPEYSGEAIGESEGMVPLTTAIKRFNATHFRVDGKTQPPLTEEEVVAAIQYEQIRRDNHDVSDALFERFQDIARTGLLPKDAAIEVVPTFGSEDGTIHTIWSVRLRLTQDEAGKEGWSYAFIIREQFISVKHGYAGKIHWGTPGSNGLQAGVRLSPPVSHFLMGQKIDVELFYRNVLTQSIEATIPNFPGYSVEVFDESEERCRILESGELIVAGAQVAWIGEQPRSMMVSPIVLAQSNLGPDDEARMLAEFDGANLVFVKPGKSYRLQFTVDNVGSNGAETLSTSELRIVVDE